MLDVTVLLGSFSDEQLMQMIEQISRNHDLSNRIAKLLTDFMFKKAAQ